MTSAVNESDWTRLWECFHAALDVPDVARAAWLSLHVPDPAERAQLDDLLAAHAQEDAAFDRPLQGESAAAGQRVGSWRLRHEIGNGGMGTVWLAERDDGTFAQRAAIKFVAAALAQPALLARFRREREILATLEHPDIARMLDGGLTAEGVPWFAMEFIDGAPLDRWLRDATPTLQRRLRLMVRLCGAVHYAHQRLVVHRDLKPSNVLVGADDRPALLDFGVAKLLENTNGSERTGTAMPAAFTPRYASPEQLRGTPVGTSSDVYSLGVMLYELSSGKPPFDTPDSSWHDFITNVTEREPLPPSARGGALQLDGELDAIVLMALRKEPERRYASAAALAEDLQRYLDHKPVRARADTTGYRLAKFVRRHRFGVGLGTAAAAALVALGIGLAIESGRTRAALADSQRERARAEETVAFLTEIFREADPTRGDGSNVSAREVLERGALLLEARRLDAASRAAVATVLGETFINTGDYARAEALFNEALVLARGIERGAQLRADALHGLGGAQQASANHAQARQTLLQAAVARRAAYGKDSLEFAATAERLGAAEQSLAHFEAARAEFDRVLTIRRARLAPDDPRIADVLLLFGALAWSQGRYDEAEPRYADALAVRRRRPERAVELARALDAVGTLAHMRGRHEEAESHYREALGLRRKVLGDGHRLTADSLGNLGALAYDRGDPAAAIPLLQESLAAQRLAVGTANPVVAKILNNLALAEAALGLRDRARTRLDEALAINRQAFGERHVRVAGNLNNLGLVLLDSGDAAAAEPLLARAIATMQSLAGMDDPQLGFALTNHARALVELGRFDDAEAVFARVLALRRKHLDAGHPSLAETLTWYGDLRCERGDTVRGEAMLEEALALRKKLFGDEHINSAQTGSLLGRCLTRAGKHERAASLLARFASRVVADPATGQPLLRRVQRLPEE